MIVRSGIADLRSWRVDPDPDDERRFLVEVAEAAR